MHESKQNQANSKSQANSQSRDELQTEETFLHQEDSLMQQFSGLGDISNTNVQAQMLSRIPTSQIAANPQLILGQALQAIPGPAPAIPGQNPVVAPTLMQRIGEKLANFFVTVKNVGVHGLLDILTTAFAIPIGLVKYLVYVPLKLLWRWILSLF